MIRVLLVDDQALVRSGFRIILESEPGIEVVGEASDGTQAVALAAELAPDVICMDVEMPEMDGIEASRRILDGSPASSAPASGAPASGAAAEPSAPPPAVLVLTTFGHEQYLFDALAAGVSGFLLKTSRAEQLIDAVRSLAAGNALLGPDVTRAVIERVAAHRASSPAPESRAGAGAVDTGQQPRSADGFEPHSARALAGAPGGSVSAIDPGIPTGPGAAGAAPGAAALDAAGLTERERQVLALLAEGMSNGEIATELFLGEATIKTHVSNVLQKLRVRDRIQAVVWAHTRGVMLRSTP